MFFRYSILSKYQKQKNDNTIIKNNHKTCIPNGGYDDCVNSFFRFFSFFLSFFSLKKRSQFSMFCKSCCFTRMYVSQQLTKNTQKIDHSC